MIKERKIQKVVNKFSFAEAEDADDLFWSNATAAENLNHMYELRKAAFGLDEENNSGGRKIAKVVNRISKYDK